MFQNKSNLNPRQFVAVANRWGEARFKIRIIFLIAHTHTDRPNTFIHTRWFAGFGCTFAHWTGVRGRGNKMFSPAFSCFICKLTKPRANLILKEFYSFMLEICGDKVSKILWQTVLYIAWHDMHPKANSLDMDAKWKGVEWTTNRRKSTDEQNQTDIEIYFGDEKSTKRNRRVKKLIRYV